MKLKLSQDVSQEHPQSTPAGRRIQIRHFFCFGWEGSLLCLEQWVVFFFCSSVKRVIVGMASSWHIMDEIASLANSRGVLSDVGGLAWSEWACSRLQERRRNFVGTYSSMRDNVCIYIFVCMYVYIYYTYIYIDVQVFGNVLTCIDMLISIPMLQMWLFCLSEPSLEGEEAEAPSDNAQNQMIDAPPVTW